MVSFTSTTEAETHPSGGYLAFSVPLCAGLTLFAMLAVVITPTVGEPELTHALRSVQGQSVGVRHLVVVDGPQHLPAVHACVEASSVAAAPDLLVLPRSTGTAGVFGHRAIAAAAFTVQEEAIFLLDADNLFHPGHVETCIATLKASGADWCYSLREIIDAEGNTLMQDDGESLGFWPRAMFYNAQRGFYSPQERQLVSALPFLVDTSCYCVKRATFTRFAWAWDHGFGADSLFAKHLIEGAKGAGTGCTTVRYRLRGLEIELRRRHFEAANELMQQLHEGTQPWRRRAAGYVARPPTVPVKLPPGVGQLPAAMPR